MNDNKYIDRIIKYAQKIIKYMKGIDSVKSLANNEEKIDAIILNLEQIGETAKRLSTETKQLYPQVEWPKIVGLRNMISHEYEGIKLDIIYDIITQRIPELLDELRVINN